MALVGEGVIRALRGLKEEGYSDQATRLIYTVGAGGYSYGTETYPEGKSFRCRVVPRPAPDMMPGTDVVRIDSDLFFSLDETLLPDDRVRVTHLHGDRLEEELDFAIVEGPVRTSVGFEAALKLVKE